MTDERDWLAERFEEHRSRLRAVAFRMLGSVSEADDAVQGAWLRLSRANASEIENRAGHNVLLALHAFTIAHGYLAKGRRATIYGPLAALWLAAARGLQRTWGTEAR